MSIAWSDRDAHVDLLTVAIAGTIGAILLALFGLPPLPHSPLHYIGVMDPLCGMTRAVRALALLQPGDAWAYNPGAFALAAFALAVGARWLIGRTTGRWLVVRTSRWVRLAGLLALVALWLNQQLNADRLMT